MMMLMFSQAVADGEREAARGNVKVYLFLTLVTDPSRSLSLKLTDTRVYEPQIRARQGVNPTPDTRNPLPSTLNHTPQTLTPKS